MVHAKKKGCREATLFIEYFFGTGFLFSSLFQGVSNRLVNF